MKTPAEVVKENFWIGAKGGLLDAKHINRMGSSVWLYMYLLRNQTGLNTAGEGIANYAHPLTFDHIGQDLKGVPASTVRKWAARLRREGYIRTRLHSKRGVIFWIAKGKNKTRKVKITNEEAQSMQMSAVKLRQKLQSVSNPTLDANQNDFRPIQDADPIVFRPTLDANQFNESRQALNDLAGTPIPEIPIPKDFTSENLSYYNKESAAKSAASLAVLFRKVARKLQPQTLPSSERQRLLDQQAKMILDKYSPGWRKATANGMNHRLEDASTKILCAERTGEARQ